MRCRTVSWDDDCRWMNFMFSTQCYRASGQDTPNPVPLISLGFFLFSCQLMQVRIIASILFCETNWICICTSLIIMLPPKNTAFMKTLVYRNFMPKKILLLPKHQKHHLHLRLGTLNIHLKKSQ